ncbi:Flp pilus assembly complex ATPase component TadA, partial [Candidatus Woesearchaeota archaeon]|nr:Flp pilus assembly complex ATPase component TadA [Candidatus Woesearchaeota archaeon]
IRGQEAFVLFQGAASGHSTMSTMHAENVDTVVRRLETPPISLSPALVEILDVVLVMTQAKLGDKYVRRVREVSEVLRVTHDRANTHQVFAWDPIKDSYSGRGSQRIFDRISKLRGWTKEQIEKEFKLRTRLLQEMTRRGIFDFKQVQDIISAYYKQPLGVLRYFGIV